MTAGPQHSPDPPAPYRHPVHVRWSDQDAFAHVNNAALAQYLQEAVAAWRRERPDVGILVARAQTIDFRNPLTYQDGTGVYVEVSVAEIRTRSVHLNFSICDPGTLYATAQAVFVAVDPLTAASRALTDTERDLFLQHQPHAIPAEPPGA